MRFLLSGGQACILYGGTEFSRDAEQVFFPPLDAEALRRGHACHFRCRLPEAAGVRLDVMATLRGCDPFAMLWERCTELELAGVGEVSVLSLRDLVQSRKTQRDKDWAATPASASPAGAGSYGATGRGTT